MKSLNIDGQQFHQYFSAQIIEDKKKKATACDDGNPGPGLVPLSLTFYN